MAINTLTRQAEEGSTYIIEVKFRDETNVMVTPKTLQWKLTDINGNIMNSRNDVAVSSPSTTNNIVLSGNDLTQGWKVFTVNATYDSIYGNDLPLNDSVKFYVKDLTAEEY